MRGKNIENPSGYLVGGLEHFLFSIIYGIILPIDELIFFKMVIAPPTSHGFLWILPNKSHPLPSGKRLHNYGQSPFFMGKSTINGHFQT